MAWATVPGCTEVEINTSGNIRYGNSKVPIPIQVDRDGRNWIKVWSDAGGMMSLRVDEATLAAQVGLPGPGEVANHIDGDERNDLAVNLEWV